MGMAVRRVLSVKRGTSRRRRVVHHGDPSRGEASGGRNHRIERRISVEDLPHIRLCQAVKAAHEKAFSGAIRPHNDAYAVRFDDTRQIINQRTLIQRKCDILNCDWHQPALRHDGLIRHRHAALPMLLTIAPENSQRAKSPIE